MSVSATVVGLVVELPKKEVQTNINLEKTFNAEFPDEKDLIDYMVVKMLMLLHIPPNTVKIGMPLFLPKHVMDTIFTFKP